ncbi:MAG: right-handed parallel beta-helix repeat-containing protein [Armatimonadetes bacterium]|nr:right-handed parallel beta-helix repeat-containing protein [Armatimonadota bacterium]
MTGTVLTPLCTLLAAALAGCIAWADAPVLYVSTQGNDGWSGTLADPAAGGQDGPFATLERARDELRAMRARGQSSAGATVYVRGGEYFLEQTFTLDARDSGVEGAPVRYVAAEGETPILIGGASLTGFVRSQGEVMSLDLASIGRKGLKFGQLFYNGKRQHLARYPNYDPDNPYAGGFLYAADRVGEGSKTQFRFEPGTFKHWERPTDGQVWIFPGVNYWNNIVGIKSVDHEAGVITLAGETSYAVNKGDRYFVQGLKEELDAPGEWYLDAERSILYFWPPGDLSKRVSAPVLSTIVSIAKTPDQADWVQDIELRGFTFEGCDGTAVTMTNARRCSITASTIRNAGGGGVTLSATKECLVAGNDIYEVGSSGVAIHSGNRNPTAPDNNVVDNNYIHHIGCFSKTSSAVSVSGVRNWVRHNLIHDTPRIAISYNGNDHVIEYNHLRHMNLETQDSGATYCLGRDWTNRGHVVRYNYIHDTLGYGRHGGTQWHSPFFTFGIYLDDWSSGQHVYGNIVARSFLAGIDVHSGRDNLIENNIIYDCAQEQMRYQEWPTSHRMLPDMLQKVLDWPFSHLYPALARHRDAVADSTQSYNTFQRNIISYGRPGSRLYAVSGLDWDTTTHDNNVLWHWSGKPDSSLDRMRDHGLDLNSVVADPLFVDPENGDFTLRPESPALKMGFEQIPQDKIGPYESHLRATWPIVEAPGAREHPHQPVRVERKVPRYPVARVKEPIQVDGKLEPGEWLGLDPAKAMLLQEDPSGDTGKRPVSRAWLVHDGTSLYVGLLNEVNPQAPLSLGSRWGGDDGAEVCIEVLRDEKPGLTFVLQGFASGLFQSTDHAGIPTAEAERLGRATQFAAQVGEGWWSGEWCVSLDALGIRPGTKQTIRFNIGVRKTGGPTPWITWVGTGAQNWLVAHAGEIFLE